MIELEPELAPTAYGIELARVEVELGMLVEAREVCLGIARMPVESDESKRSADAREEAAKLAEAVRPRIGAVVLKLTPAETKAELIVEVDGVRVPEAALNEPRRVNPGAHDVRAQYEGGEPVTVHVSVGEAESKDVALAPVPPKVVIAPPPPPPPTGPAPKPPRTGLAPLTVAGFITAGVGLALGGSAGIAAMVYKSNLACPNNVCSGDDVKRLDDANFAANVSNVGFIVAGIGAVLTVVGFLTTPARTTMGQRSITPDVGLGWAGVHGTF